MVAEAEWILMSWSTVFPAWRGSRPNSLRQSHRSCGSFSLAQVRVLAKPNQICSGIHGNLGSGSIWNVTRKEGTHEGK